MTPLSNASSLSERFPFVFRWTIRSMSMAAFASAGFHCSFPHGPRSSQADQCVRWNIWTTVNKRSLSSSSNNPSMFVAGGFES